jgi:hypothetical protein
MDHPATSDRKGPAVRPHHVAFTVADLKRALLASISGAAAMRSTVPKERAAPRPGVAASTSRST